MDQVSDDLEVVVIKRRGRASVAMIDADELSSILETEYLLRSPKNSKVLSRALRRTEAGTTPPSTIEDLKKEFGVR
jgi:antitoxin YefM